MNKQTLILTILALGFLAAVLFWPTQPSNERNMTNETLNDNQVAIIKTNYGDIEIEFFSELAPKTVDNFLTLSKEGFYNGTRFHRIIPEFMIQGGDPNSRDPEASHLWGTGGPGYEFEDEIHQENINKRGALAMANAGPNTNGSQFFINLADNDFLNDKHTVFGQVVSGMDVVDQIASIETNERDVPNEEVLVEEIIVN